MSPVFLHMSDTRFYMLSALGFTGFAIAGGIVLKAIGISQAQILTVTITIMGFATLAITQFRTAAMAAEQVAIVSARAVSAAVDASDAATRASEVGVQASEAAVKASDAVKEVKNALSESSYRAADDLHKMTAGITERLTNLADIANSTHVLVNSQRGVLLQAHADLWERLANLTESEADRSNANIARISFSDHTSQQTELDAKTERNQP